MVDPISNRRQLEEFWRERVREAELRFGLAQQCMKKVQQDLPRSKSPYTSFAVSEALRAENEALRQYFLALEIFTNLVLHGKIPHEGGCLKS